MTPDAPAPAPVPRMSYPFLPWQIFNHTAELYGSQHPQRPGVILEGEWDEVQKSGEAYRTGWIGVVWPDFRRWWAAAPDVEKRRKAEEALRPRVPEPLDFWRIPDAGWEQVRALRPADGDTPFIEKPLA